MTRAEQINLKQRINSTLNNEQRVISSKWIYKVSRDGIVALPRGATGLSAVCDCGIS